MAQLGKLSRASSPDVLIARTADRALRIFELFAEHLRPMTLSDLARALDIPGSTCSKLMGTLRARGYLYEVGGRKAFYPTTKWLEKSREIAACDPLVDTVAPHLARLRDETAETVLLGKRMGDSVIFISIFESFHDERFHGQVGQTKLLFSSASGKAILSAMDRGECLSLLARQAVNAGPSDTIEERKQLLQEIGQGRVRGWWSSSIRQSLEITAYACPVRLGPEICALTLAAPSPRVNAGADLLTGRLLRTAKALELACGSSGSRHAVSHM